MGPARPSDGQPDPAGATPPSGPAPSGDIAAALRRAAASSYGGRLQVTVGSTVVGQVFFVDGRIAWATCKNQRETLGTFLWRLGHLTRTQLELVSKVHVDCQGKKKVGQILEDLGLMTTPLLHRCLLLHTRAAVAALLACPDATTSLVPGSLGTDEEQVFDVEEVLPVASTDAPPESSAGRMSQADWTARSERNEVLVPLAAVPGYRAALVASSDGSLATAHATALDLDLALLGAHVTSLMDNVSRLAASAHLGALGVATVACGGGCAVVRWLDEQQSHIVAVIVTDPERAHAAGAAIDGALPALRAWAGSLSVASFFKRLLEKAKTEREQLNTVKVAIRVRLRELKREGRSNDAMRRLEDALSLLDQGRLADALALLAEPGSGLAG